MTSGQANISDHNGRSRKVWELFKFLLAHQGQTLLPEVILEKLWPDQEYAEPKNTVRALVLRLRRLLGDDAGLIVFCQGGYTLKAQGNLHWDAPAFEAYCLQAHKAAMLGNETETIERYRQALSLYKGDFLPECVYNDWATPFRNYYHRLYRQAVCKLLGILKENGRHEEIITEADKALFIDFFEEEFHLFYLEALLAAGKTSQARSHYQNITAVFNREMGIKPSAALKRLLRLIQSADEKDNVLDFMPLRETLQSREQAHSAFCCEPEFLHFLCRLESRRMERSGHQVALATISIGMPDYRMPADKVLKEAMPLLQELLQAGLRKSDVLSRLNEHQFVALLPAASMEQAQAVLQRIADRFHVRDKCGLLLKYRLMAL